MTFFGDAAGIGTVLAAGVVVGGSVVRGYHAFSAHAVKKDKIDRVLAAVLPNGNALAPHEVEGHLVLEGGETPSLADLSAANWRRMGRLEETVNAQGVLSVEHWTESTLIAKQAKVAADAARVHAAKAERAAAKAADDVIAMQAHLARQDTVLESLQGIAGNQATGH